MIQFQQRANFILFFCSAMDSNPSSKLVLCGKSSAENEMAKSLKANNTLKLPNNGEASIILQSEIVESVDEESFNVELYMNSLSTNQFGRFLIWSPRLSSTHDVVSQYVIFFPAVHEYLIYILFYQILNSFLVFYSNFCELPVGSVCVADVQFKGRGIQQAHHDNHMLYLINSS